MKSERDDKRKKLETYRAKRSAERTPEPFGPGPDRPRLFVVQQHAARRMHYDLRLEWAGVLWSWAVPKGPSPDPAARHLAVHVEDHPVEYAEFEGVIPEGNYGAGAVIVWDRGTWSPHGDPEAGLREGKLHFDLHGYKLRGEWILVRPAGREPKDWILLKKKDAYSGVAGYPPESIVSGRTVDEVRRAGALAASIRKDIEAAGAAARTLDVPSVGLMLAGTSPKSFSSKDWLFELKYDGYRVIPWKDPDGRCGLRSRNGQELAPVFPEITHALKALPHGRLVMDGEIVVLDDEGRSVFQRLQKRAQARRPRDVKKASAEHPATLFVFDLLEFEGLDVRPLPLRERKGFLARVVPRVGPVRYVDHIEEDGNTFFEKTGEFGLEGIMAKKVTGPYKAGRSGTWLKIPHSKTGVFVVCGYTAPRGSRVGLGALHLGVHDGDVLRYTGRVGTGMGDRFLEQLIGDLRTLHVERPACAGGETQGRDTTWIRPARVAEVRYKDWTDEGVLRAPVFIRMREDLSPRDCRRESREEVPIAIAPVPDPEDDAAGDAKGRARVGRRVDFSNLDKVYWPDEGITKGDLIEYYRSVAPWMLPYLKDRPLVLTRYPDGINGKSFYQKNAPEFAPGWIRRQRIYSGHAGKEIDYFVCDTEDSLLYLVNMGTIPFHVWPSRADTIQTPDWCILDLDPKGAPFEHVILLARTIHEICETIRLPNYVKTTGSSGLHILIPLGAQCTFEQSRLLAHLIARIVETRHREIATTERSLDNRKGRVYLDYLQNRHGQLIVAPYSVRPLPGAPVSAPLRWNEVGGKLEPRQFDVRNLAARLRRRKEDPLLPVLTDRPDLLSALDRLAGLTEHRA